MGANKQSRFGGQQPRYKNIERTVLADIFPVERNLDDEADQFLEERRQSTFKEARYISSKPAMFKVAPNPELEELVKRYVAARHLKEPVGNPKLEAHNNEILLAPEAVRLKTPEAIEPKQAAPISHDVLLQLFSERKITLGHFHAGRRWQWDREAATIQPNTSIDWSQSSPSPYQSEEMSERQWGAIRRRRVFAEHSGLAAATMLDFLLEVDRSRSDLMKLTGLPAVQIECALEELLEKVCECFAE